MKQTHGAFLINIIIRKYGREMKAESALNLNIYLEGTEDRISIAVGFFKETI